jgi:hypothetical protein
VKSLDLSTALPANIKMQNFFWVPLAIYYGKRPVFLVSSALLVASTAWAARATSFESLLAASALTGIAGGSTEAIGGAIVNVSHIFCGLSAFGSQLILQDIFFLHQRGTKMSIYILSLALANSLAPLICGYIIQGMSFVLTLTRVTPL